MNTTVLMSSARYFSNEQQINPYYAEESVNSIRAVEEHERLRQIIEQAGITVHKVDAPANSQDGVYTANWALIRNDKAVIAKLPEARRAEEEWAVQTLKSFDIEAIRVPNGLRFSGQGDALPCGNFLFCGQGYRSDIQAQAFAADVLGYERIQLQTVPQLDLDGAPVINATSKWADSFFYDIDLAMAVIREPTALEKGLIAYCPSAFTAESLRTLTNLESTFDFIQVSETEATGAFACNLISTGSTVIMSAHAPHFQSSLEAQGLHILTPEVVELAKGGGFIRCQTLSFN